MAANRVQIKIKGVVQGVGFRPFIYRLAHAHVLSGWVRNGVNGVEVEVEGPESGIRAFLWDISAKKPALSTIEKIEVAEKALEFPAGFQIIGSDLRGEPDAVMLPDTATCPECMAEVLEPKNRRYRYPFTTCTTCGPRFSIASGLPFDRTRTSMAVFSMCPECEGEYGEAQDRRFHSQTNCCPACGPALALLDQNGQRLAIRDEALKQAAQLIRAGKILALKGVGGYQIILDARNEVAVAMLRERKHRRDKPFAIMAGSLREAEDLCFVSEVEREALISPQAPIVLLKLRPSNQSLAPNIAPGINLSGIMLPYSPLHHLLLRELKFPIVATSGNISDEPICITEEQAFRRLRGTADIFLVYNREIENGLDDSIVRVIGNQAVILRRARGFAPQSFGLVYESANMNWLATGSHLKNTIAVVKGQKIHVSQHLGTLDSAESYELFEQQARKLPQLYGIEPQGIVCDLHPDYFSTIYAQKSLIPPLQVQHHYAHVLACMGEHGAVPPCLGVALDGSGYGPDHTVWGGEFLLIKPDWSYERVGQFRPFKLPGGERAVEEPRRAALGVLYELFGRELFAGSAKPQVQAWLLSAFRPGELKVLEGMLARSVNSPWCSSAGRLFDAVSSLAGLRHVCHFEGQAAMELESIALELANQTPYPMTVRKADEIFQLDWGPLVVQVLKDCTEGEGMAVISARFHGGLARGILEMARAVGETQLALSGGVFQNKLLSECVMAQLQRAGYQALFHAQVPPNDGGISFGQAVAAVVCK